MALPMGRGCCRGGSDDCPGTAGRGDHRQTGGSPGAHATAQIGDFAAPLGKEGGGAGGLGPGAADGDDRPVCGQLALAELQPTLVSLNVEM